MLIGLRFETISAKTKLNSCLTVESRVSRVQRAGRSQKNGTKPNYSRRNIKIKCKKMIVPVKSEY